MQKKINEKTEEKISSLMFSEKKLHSILDLSMKGVRAEVQIPRKIEEADKLDKLMVIADKTEKMEKV